MKENWSLAKIDIRIYVWMNWKIENEKAVHKNELKNQNPKIG